MKKFKKILIVSLSLAIISQLSGAFNIAKAYADESATQIGDGSAENLAANGDSSENGTGALEEGATENFGSGEEGNSDGLEVGSSKNNAPKNQSGNSDVNLMPAPKNVGSDTGSSESNDGSKNSSLGNSSSRVVWDPGIVINNDDIYTSSRDVELELEAYCEDEDGDFHNATEMRFKNESDPAWPDLSTGWETYTTTKSWNLSPVDGTKTVYVQFSVNVGGTWYQSPEYQDSIILDRVGPAIDIDLTDGDFVSGDVVVDAKATDENEVMPGSLVLEIVGTTIIENSFPYTWDTTAQSDGPYIISFEAYDKAGNLGTANVTLNVDNTAPEIDHVVFNSADGSLIGPGSEVDIEVYLINAETGEASGTFNDKVLAWTMDSDIGGPYYKATYTVEAGDLSTADAELQVTVTDRAGNTSLLYTENSGIEIDTTAPDAPTSISVIAGTDNIKISWLASLSPDVAGYNIYRASSPYKKINNALINGTSYTDYEVEQGIEYFYKITAVDGAGNETLLGDAITSQMITLTSVAEVVGQILESAATTSAGPIPVAKAAPAEHGQVKGEGAIKTEPQTESPQEESAEPIQNWPMIIAIIIAALIIVAGIWYYWVVTRPAQEYLNESESQSRRSSRTKRSKRASGRRSAPSKRSGQGRR